MRYLKSRSGLSFAIFALVLAISGSSLLTNRQLGHLGGMTDEWFDLGLNISVFGEFSLGGKDPVVFRPPGYPFYVAGVSRLAAGAPDLREVDTEGKWAEWNRFADRSVKAVYVSQCLLLALSSLILFLWACDYFSTGVAFFAALLYGANPYTVMLTGLLHYDILHTFLLILATFLLDRSLRDRDLSMRMLLVGGLWGLATLVRPVTLTLPVFITAIFLVRFRPSRARAVRAAALFTLGMAVVILPYTARNYSITKRIIPVNAQAWTAVWGSTVRKFRINPDHYNWYRVYPDPYEKVFYRATGQPYTYEGLIRNNMKVEDEFRKSAIENLKASPGVYAHNFITSFFTLSTDINAVFIKIFQYVQATGRGVDKAWFVPGAPQVFYPGAASTAFRLLVYLLTVFSLAGLIISIRRRDGFFLVPGTIYLALAASHSMAYFDLMYYYIKVPFLFLFSFYFINALGRYKIRGVPAASAAIALVCVYTFVLDAIVL
ncbi:MAG: glycosyltransferase family 39 protein [Thermodesulfobacteriota bacterium]